MIIFALLAACTGAGDPAGTEGSDEDAFIVGTGTDGADAEETTDEPDSDTDAAPVQIAYQTWDMANSCFGPIDVHDVDSEYWATALASIPDGSVPLSEIPWRLAVTIEADCVMIMAPYSPEFDFALTDPFFNGDPSLFPDCQYPTTDPWNWCDGVEWPGP